MKFLIKDNFHTLSVFHWLFTNFDLLESKSFKELLFRPLKPAGKT